MIGNDAAGMHLSLLQLDQVHSHGVTPDFFDTVSGPSGPEGGFEPKASEATAAAVAKAAHASFAEAAAAAVKAGAPVPPVREAPLGAMKLMQPKEAEPSIFSMPKAMDMAGEAGRIFSLVAEGARAAVRNVAPTWLVDEGPPSRATAAAVVQEPVRHVAGPKTSQVIVDASRGHNYRQVPPKPRTTSELKAIEADKVAEEAIKDSTGLLAKMQSTKTTAGAQPTARPVDESPPGAMNFFGNALRRPEGGPAPVVMLATATAQPAAPETAARPAERGEDEMEVLSLPKQTPAEVEARNQHFEALRAAELREASRLSQQANLEDQMEDVRNAMDSLR